ncbi:MAG: hypothetical protein WA628_01765 [Terriglobales bacterium]
MRIRAVCAVFVSLAVLIGVGFRAAHEYQVGKIVKVERRQSRGPSGGTDAPLTSEVVPYRISIRLGDNIYVCGYQTGPERDLSWTEGKDVEARVSGKVMYVKKANGKEAKGSILSTAPAANP